MNSHVAADVSLAGAWAASDAEGDSVSHRRATVRPDKAAAVAEIAEAFRGSAAAVLTDYRGLTVKQISDLRVALGADTTYSVVKNTLTKIAAADAGVTGIDALLEGPTAVAFIQGEPVQAAKALRDFAKANPVLVVKGGVMDGHALTPDDVRKLADLGSREAILAGLARAVSHGPAQAASTLAAPLARMAALLDALAADTPGPTAEPEPDDEPPEIPDDDEIGIRKIVLRTLVQMSADERRAFALAFRDMFIGAYG